MRDVGLGELVQRGVVGLDGLVCGIERLGCHHWEVMRKHGMVPFLRYAIVVITQE